MALDHLIAIAREHFQIEQIEEWCYIRPEWILQLEGCGPATLDHIRLYLAARGLTLKGDQSPAYWQQHLESAKIGGQMAGKDVATVEPYTIIIDTKEQQPFTFQGFMESGSPVIIQTTFRDLGPSHGDYSIDGLEGVAHIERKGVSDAQSTFLASGERRDRWIATLEFLAGIECSAVVIEGSFAVVLETLESRGARSRDTLKKTLHRQVLAWQQDYRVPFIWCDNRRLAEATSRTILRRHWMQATGLKKTRQEVDRSAIDRARQLIAGL
jgi:hypothetical protein